LPAIESRLLRSAADRAVLSVRIERTAQGKLDEAKPLMKESLAIKKKSFGSDHPKVAIGLTNLATLYYGQASSAR